MSTLAVNAITNAAGGNTATINGMTPTADSLQGFRNRILNGSFAIAQRATSATITAGSTIAAGYSTVDRFYVYCTGANVTAAQTTNAAVNALRITGAASVTAVGVGQRIEASNSYDLANTTATFSVSLANSLLTTVTWTAFYANTTNTFGTLASPTRTQIATGTFTVTSTLTRYTANITVPSAATTGIEIVLTVGAQTSGTWDIGNVQLEAGSVATNFQRRPYGTELALCQRYYYKVQATSANAFFGVGFCESTTVAYGITAFPVPMRTAPSALEQTGTAGNYQVTKTASNIVCTSVPTFGNGELFSARTTFTTGATLVAGQGGILRSVNSSAYLAWSAEL